jgi:hypothetical protein
MLMILLCSISLICFYRILNAVLWFANQSIYSLGGQAQTIKQSFHFTWNKNRITNNYLPVSQPLVTLNLFPEFLVRFLL